MRPADDVRIAVDGQVQVIGRGVVGRDQPNLALTPAHKVCLGAVPGR